MIGLCVHFCFFLLLVSHDDYSIDIYSFGICALEVSDYSVVIKSTLPHCASDVKRWILSVDGRLGDSSQW